MSSTLVDQLRARLADLDAELERSTSAARVNRFDVLDERKLIAWQLEVLDPQGGGNAEDDGPCRLCGFEGDLGDHLREMHAAAQDLRATLGPEADGAPRLVALWSHHASDDHRSLMIVDEREHARHLADERILEDLTTIGGLKRLADRYWVRDRSAVPTSMLIDAELGHEEADLDDLPDDAAIDTDRTISWLRETDSLPPSRLGVYDEEFFPVWLCETILGLADVGGASPISSFESVSWRGEAGDRVIEILRLHGFEILELGLDGT